jgi:hypothetical protein
MKKTIFIVVGSLAIAGIYLFGVRDPAGAGDVVQETSQPLTGENIQHLEQSPPMQAPIEQPMQTSGEEDDPIMVKTPVQPLEERDDSMLFEIDALGGTPFDQSITMPFD